MMKTRRGNSHFLRVSNEIARIKIVLELQTKEGSKRIRNDRNR